MARIKSALEIAMEKTEHMTIDKGLIEEKELKNQGKRLASHFMDANGDFDVAPEFKKYEKEKLLMVKKGFAEILLSYLQLPASKEQNSKIDAVSSGFSALQGGLFSDKKNTAQFDELKAFFAQYFNDLEHLEEAVQRQFAPKLKQKEAEMAKRTGREAAIDPFKDPEFMAFFTKNLVNLKTQYQNALDQVKADLLEQVK